MCAEIVDLDALIGGDLVFKYEGKELKIPGDISTKTVFEIFHAFESLQNVNVKGDAAEIERANDAIGEQLLKLFQIRDPEMTVLPFGIKTLPVVIRSIMALLGVKIADDEGGPSPLTRSATKPKKRTTAKKPRGGRSARSSGSRS